MKCLTCGRLHNPSKAAHYDWINSVAPDARCSKCYTDRPYSIFMWEHGYILCGHCALTGLTEIPFREFV
jgi:hypothetical protein